MAREKKPPIDPDNFIERVRQRSVPGYQRAVEANTNDPPENQIAANSENKADNHAPPVDSPSKPEVAVPSGPDNEVYDYKTDAETAFIRKFLDRENFRQVNRNGVHIFISREHHQMILDLKGLLKSDVNISTYVDNVLTEHFEKYYSLIEDIEARCPRKFPKRK